MGSHRLKLWRVDREFRGATSVPIEVSGKIKENKESYERDGDELFAVSYKAAPRKTRVRN
jgi:hypothetical protein